MRMISLLCIFLFLFGCVPTSDYSQIKVVKVIDGDTVKLSNGKMLRYIGIDTPEIHIKKGEVFVYQPEPFAFEAKELNQKLIENKWLKVEFDAEREDHYGRLLGYCFVNGTFVNAKLIEEGLAVLYTKPPNVKYVDIFVAAQKKARQEKKGLWASYEAIAAEDAHQHTNQIRTVQGRVLKTSRSKKAVFLNFGLDYKTDFTVVIFANSLPAFLEKGINPRTYYKGKIVEVTGRIKEYNGPEIIINSPSEITIVPE